MYTTIDVVAKLQVKHMTTPNSSTIMFKELANFLFPQTAKALAEATLEYNGMRKLIVYHQIGDIQVCDRMELDLGERPWTYQMEKKVVQEIAKEFGEQIVELRFDGQVLNIVPSGKDSVSIAGTNVEPPNWELDEIIYIQLTPAEWGKIEEVSSIVKKHFDVEIYKGVNFVATGDTLEVIATELRTKTQPSFMVSQIIKMETAIDKDLNIIVPVDAIRQINNGTQDVTVEVGTDKFIIRQNEKCVKADLIHGDYPPIGLIPDGELKTEIKLQSLHNFISQKDTSKPQKNKAKDKGEGLDPKDTVLVSANLKEGKLALAAANKDTKAIRPVACGGIMLNWQYRENYPDKLDCNLAASVLLDVIRLIGLAQMAKVTLSLPIGLQAVTIIAGATRFVLPTVVSKSTQLKINEILNPNPNVRSSESITVDVGTPDEPKTITMTSQEVEHIPEADEVENPSSEKEGLENLAKVSKKAKSLAKKLSPDVELEATVSSELTKKVAEAEQILQQGDTLSPEKALTLKGCPLGPKEIGKLTAALVRMMSRVQSVILKTEKGEVMIAFTFNSETEK